MFKATLIVLVALALYIDAAPTDTNNLKYTTSPSNNDKYQKNYQSTSNYNEKKNYDAKSYDNNAGYSKSYDNNNSGYSKSYDNNNSGYSKSYDNNNAGYSKSYDNNNAGYSRSYDSNNAGYSRSNNNYGRYGGSSRYQNRVYTRNNFLDDTKRDRQNQEIDRYSIRGFEIPNYYNRPGPYMNKPMYNQKREPFIPNPFYHDMDDQLDGSYPYKKNEVEEMYRIRYRPKYSESNPLFSYTNGKYNRGYKGGYNRMPYGGNGGYNRMPYGGYNPTPYGGGYGGYSG